MWREELLARTVVPIVQADIGREVAVCFAEGSRSEPLILGFVLSAAQLDAARSPVAPLVAKVEQERVVIRAEHEIELRCGKSSLVLSADGKIVLKGESLLSRATGPHRIRGGSVQIN